MICGLWAGGVYGALTFIQGEHRGQSTLLPESLDDYVADTNPVRVVDFFVDELDLGQLGFDGVVPAEKVGQPTILPIS